MKILFGCIHGNHGYLTALYHRDYWEIPTDVSTVQRLLREGIITPTPSELPEIK